MPVNTPRKDYKDMCDKWSRLRDGFAGRDAVLDAGHKYVPDLAGLTKTENRETYRVRGNYYNATSRTVIGLVGSLFQKPPKFDFPSRFESWLDDVTLSNVTMEMFALETIRDVMLIGRYGVLVDMAPASDLPTLAPRPYLLAYKAEEIINWQTTRVNGDEQLTMVVLCEHVDEPNASDPFQPNDVLQYRVLEVVNGVYQQQLWRKPANKDWEKYKEPIIPMRRGKTLNFIPFVFVGPAQVTPDVKQPPLLDLVDVNLGHWRNSVDYEYGLHLIALPTPWVSGAKGDPSAPLKIGPANVWDLNENGAAGMLEFTGQGLGALAAAMEEKKKQMSTLGARMLEAPANNAAATATEVLLRHSGEYATLSTVAHAAEQGFTMILQMLAWWVTTDALPQDVQASCELNKEFTAVKADPLMVQTALTALQADKISFETFYNILATGGWARDDVTAEQELLDIKKNPKPATPAVTPQQQQPPVAA